MNQKSLLTYNISRLFWFVRKVVVIPNPKLENLLNLALAASTSEKEKSLILGTGYTSSTNTWELIVKYHGALEKLNSEVIQVEPLTNGYAIVTIREDFIDAFSKLDEVEYIEKPKFLSFISM